MFERFTESALKVVFLAQQETRKGGHAFVGTEQILIGLLLQGTGIAAKVLQSVGLDAEKARDESQKITGLVRGSPNSPEEAPFTPRGKRLLEAAWEESKALDHRHIGTEHMLLALVKEQETVAGRVLDKLGIDRDAIRTKVLDIVKNNT